MTFLRSSVCNAEDFYVDPVVLNELGLINIVCEGFVIIETHDAYTSILESLFQVSTSRNKKNVYAILTDGFMTRKILESIEM